MVHRIKIFQNSPKRDWYIWKEPVHGKPPNNWLGTFGGLGWEFDKRTGEYYYHSFLKEQPDLNWRNPEVEEAIFKMIRFWLEMGVDGFRLDVVNLYVKDEFLRDNISYFMKGPRPYDKQVHTYDRDRPEMHGILRRLRKLLDSYEPERMSVGEVMQDFPGNVTLPATYCGRNDELHLAFNFMFLFSPWKAEKFFQIVKDFESALGEDNWPNYTLSNHDFPRHITRYMKGKETIPRARIAAVMMLTLRGTPFLYYGRKSEWRDKRFQGRKSKILSVKSIGLSIREEIRKEFLWLGTVRKNRDSPLANLGCLSMQNPVK